MDLGANQKIRLLPSDEYNHPIEDAINFNESMYINLFDHQQKMGGWFRVGNRPNEQYAEMSCCLYLPDGRVGFMFQRPTIDSNDELNAGGMKFEVIEPFKKLRVTYAGKLCVLQNPAEMENPKEAFKNNPILDCSLTLDFFDIAPVYGGEAVDENDNPIEENPEESFARAHYEQHMGGKGSIKVGNESWKISGFGLRDHSWGPRYWQNLYWYRWIPMAFNEDFAMNVSIVTMASGKQNIWGMVLDKDRYVLIDTATLQTEYDENYYPLGYKIEVTDVEGRSFSVNAKVISQIPLRNRRQNPNDGSWMKTRIIEGMTEFECNNQMGYGMTEYLDQIIDDEPVGKHC